MTAVTKRRTTHGHLQAWFVDKPIARAPLTPLASGEPRRPQQQKRAGWSKQNRRYHPLWRGGWGGRGMRSRRPCKPGGRTYSDRAPSLRASLPLPLALYEFSVLQSGTHFDGREPLFTENEPVCLAKLPVWLDEFGSNELLFAPPTQLCDDVNGGAPAAVESTAVSADARLPGPTER